MSANPAEGPELVRLFLKQFQLCDLKKGESVVLLSNAETDRVRVQAAFAVQPDLNLLVCNAGGFFDVQACNDTNRVDLFVFASDTQVLVMSRLDNLGKGASGAAVQNLDLMLAQ